MLRTSPSEPPASGGPVTRGTLVSHRWSTHGHCLLAAPGWQIDSSGLVPRGQSHGHSSCGEFDPKGARTWGGGAETLVRLGTLNSKAPRHHAQDRAWCRKRLPVDGSLSSPPKRKQAGPGPWGPASRVRRAGSRFVRGPTPAIPKSDTGEKPNSQTAKARHRANLPLFPARPPDRMWSTKPASTGATTPYHTQSSRQASAEPAQHQLVVLPWNGE